LSVFFKLNYLAIDFSMQTSQVEKSATFLILIKTIMKNWDLLAAKLSELPIVEQLTQKKQKVDALRPLSADLEGRVMQKLRLDWNYHSNAIEGNPMSHGETITYLMHGLTAKGKTLKDHLDIRGHNEAIHLLMSIVKDERGFSESDIRKLHRIILVEPYHSKAITPDGNPTQKLIQLGQYKTQPNSVRTPTGEMHYYATPEDVPILMGELIQWYRHVPKSEIHAVVIGAIFHHRFVAIHPFDDGNGRLGRILMNLILMQQGYPPAIIKLKDRNEYITALEYANRGDYELLVNHIGESLKDSLDIYLRAAHGERVEEMGDVDKEIALFVGGFEPKKLKLIQKSTEVIDNTLNRHIFNFLNMLFRKLDAIMPLFLDRTIKFRLNDLHETLYQNNDLISSHIKKEKQRKTDFQINNIYVYYKYEGFKTDQKSFDYSIEFNFIFEKAGYQIKNYHQRYGFIDETYQYAPKIGYAENMELVEKIVKKTMQDIKQKFES
jgi:Fic family protein